MNSYTINFLIILIYGFLVVCVMIPIFFPNISLMHELVDMSYLVTHLVKRVIVFMILVHKNFFPLEMWFFHKNIFLFSTSLFENQDDTIVLPTPSYDPLSLPKPYLAHHLHRAHDPKTQATLDLTISNSPTTSPHPSHVAINNAPHSSLDAPKSSSPPITLHLPLIPSSPSMDIHPPFIHKSTRSTKPPSHFKDYQAHHATLLASSVSFPIMSGTRYSITRYVSHSNFSEHHRIFINNIS